MRRAVALSRRGFPAPNPHVGCVIVRDGIAVGEGWHEAAGRPLVVVIFSSQERYRAHGKAALGEAVADVHPRQLAGDPGVPVRRRGFRMLQRRHGDVFV